MEKVLKAFQSATKKILHPLADFGRCDVNPQTHKHTPTHTPHMHRTHTPHTHTLDKECLSEMTADKRVF